MIPRLGDGNPKLTFDFIEPCHRLENDSPSRGRKLLPDLINFATLTAV